MAGVAAGTALAAFGTLDIIASRPTLVLIALTLATFGWAVAGSFHFDDYSLLGRELSPLHWPRPLTYLTFWLNSKLGGYHGVNVALHVGSVVLLYAALSRLLPQHTAFLGTAIFAVHPFVSEPVNYVFARPILLATWLCLGSLLAWLKEWRWTAVWLFAAALLAKEECAAFPLVLLWLRRRDWVPVTCMLGVSVVVGVGTAITGALIPGSGIAGQAGISPLHYGLAQGPVILRYVRMLVLPWGFTVDPDIRVPHIWVGLLAWGGVMALVVVVCAGVAKSAGTARKSACAAVLLGFILLLPSSSIFPANDLAADRRMYLPMVCFAPAIALALNSFRWRYAVVAILALLSFLRTNAWHSELSLWTDAVAKAPHKARPLLQLARATGGQPGLDLLAQAKTITPQDPDIPTEEGRIDLTIRKPQDALTAFGRALALDPGNAAAYNNRGVALLMMGQREAARADFNRALQIDPGQPDARMNLSRLGYDHK